jgi:predicted GIY-YIG superfamily endonuclease
MNEQDQSQKVGINTNMLTSAQHFLGQCTNTFLHWTQPLSRSQQHQHQQPPREVDYRQAIQTLETKRGHLIQQKIQLERKIQDLRQSQKLQAEEEQSKKELNLKR